MPTELFTLPPDPLDHEKVRELRRAALQKAADDGIGSLRPAESQWASEQARMSAEAGVHEIPDIAARRAAEAGHAGQVAVEHVPDSQPVPVGVDRSILPPTIR